MSDTKPTPRRVPEEQADPWEHALALVREYGERGCMECHAVIPCKFCDARARQAADTIAALDAERAANAEMRKALEDAAAQSAQYRLLLVETLQQCSEVMPWVLREELRYALRAAEKAPETTEPVRMMLVTHASVKTGAMVAHLRDQAADMMWHAFGALPRRATPEEALEALATWLDARAELKAAEKAGGR